MSSYRGGRRGGYRGGGGKRSHDTVEMVTGTEANFQQPTFQKKFQQGQQQSFGQPQFGQNQQFGQQQFGTQSQFNQQKQHYPHDHYHDSRRQQGQDQIFVVVIEGFPENTTRKDLLYFLNQKASFRFLQSEFNNGKFSLQVGSKEEAQSLLNVNGAFFNNAKLSVDVKQQQGSSFGQQQQSFASSSGRGDVGGGMGKPYHFTKRVQFNMQKLGEFLQTVMSSDQTLMDLHQLHTTDFVRLSDQFNMNDPDFVDSFFFQCQKIGASAKVVSLILAGNGISSLAGFSRFRRNFPNCVNLSLDNNNIDNFDELDYIRDVPGNQQQRQQPTSVMREISFQGNPIYEKLKKIDSKQYTQAILQRFPDLKFLDTEALQQVTFATDLTKNKTMELPPPKGNYFESDQIRDLVFSFVNQYFQLYDGDRSKLLGVYDENACFTYSVSTKEGFEKDRKALESLFGMQGMSRNLQIEKDIKKRQLLLFEGKIKILNQLVTNMSKTKHDYNSFIADSVLVNVPNQKSNLMLVIHGAYQEATGFIRSFDRTFILSPPQQNTGWPVVIINDELHVRAYMEFKLQNLSLSPSNGNGIGTTGGTEQQVTGGEDQKMKEFTIKQLMNETGMNENYSTRCLDEVKWVYPEAMSLFEKCKNTLPKEAFMK